MPSKVTKARKPRAITPDTHHVRWFLAGVTVGLGWTLVACGLAFLQGDDVRSFLREWTNLQGPFLIALGTWLLLMIRSRSFTARVSRLTADGSVNPGIFKNRIVRFLIVGFVTVLGFISVASMGFNGHGVVLVFMWITCICIDFASGLVTLHSLELLAVIHNLQQQEIKVSRYAPARTPELRSLVSYFSSFTLLMTVGYAFALLGTLKGHWTGSQDYIQAVRLFWPLIYVPTCCVVLIYPHIVVHKLIQREKERTLSSCQQDMDKLLSKYGNLKTEEVERTNTLAQLFDRVTATPDYVIDFGIAVRTILPLAFNLVTLFVKSFMGQS
ncbi:MAG TPA: hypothetical protein VGC66_13810 [Pyrinomonadaceae bacterium]|jgi:hypothetical protein